MDFQPGPGAEDLNREGFLRSNKANLIVLLAYLFIALIIFWPMTANIAGTVAGTGGDPYQSMWNLWWVPYSLFTLHQSFWTTNMVFWPVGANLIYQTLMPLGAILVSPFQSVSPMLAYNMLFFIGIVISGFGMYVLSDYIVRNRYAAFIAGIIFAFSAFHIAQAYGHLDYANIGFVPLSIYMLLRAINRDYIRVRYGKYATAAALSLLFVLCISIGELEQGLILVMAMVLITLGYAVSRSQRAKVLNAEFASLAVVFIVVTFVLGSWMFIPVINGLSTSTVNQLNDVYHNAIWSDDIVSFFLPSYYNGVFNGAAQSYISIYHQDAGETTSYIGYVALALCAYGVYRAGRQTYLWIALGVIFFLLALGPYLLINNNVTGVPGPYMIIKAIPILNVIREPGRFDLIVSVAVAILAAFGAKALFERMQGSMGAINGRKLLGAAAVISILILLETAAPPLSGSLAANITTTPNVSSLYKYLGNESASFSVLQLPILPDQYSTQPGLYPGEAMFSTIYTHKPVLGGYLTRENVTQESTLYNIPMVIDTFDMEIGLAPGYFSVINQSYVNQTLLALYLYNATVVTLDKSAYNGTTLPAVARYMEGIFGAPPYSFSNDSIVGWSTVNAVSSAAFKSYVAFPSVSEWNASRYRINGTNVTLWKPAGDGLVLAYAPYLNGNYNSASYSVNTIITVSAVSLGGASQLGIGRITNSGITRIALLNISGGIRDYSFAASLSPGDYGNGLVFQLGGNGQQSSAAGITGIRFSLGTN